MSVTNGLSNVLKRSLTSLSSLSSTLSSSLSTSLASSSTVISYSTPFSDISFTTSRENALINDSLGYAKGLTTNASSVRINDTSTTSQISYASPESDFTSLHAPSFLEPVKETVLSFASPESDFIGIHIPSDVLKQGQGMASILAQRTNINFATAESDYSSPSIREIALSEEYAAVAHGTSFAAPESDFCSNHAPSFLSHIDHDKLTPLTFSSPESDFVGVHIPTKYNAVYPDTKLTYTSPESDFAATNTAKAVYLDMLIPKTLQGALSSNKAVVVTECIPPFKITHVNSAWEGLCGFSRAEAIGKTPRELLHGPLTQTNRLQSLTDDIHKTKLPSQAILTNYNKRGEPFENRLTIAPFSINGINNLTHLIAVLEPISNDKAATINI